MEAAGEVECVSWRGSIVVSQQFDPCTSGGSTESVSTEEGDRKRRGGGVLVLGM